MTNNIRDLLAKMTPEEQAEVENYAAYLLARRKTRRVQIISDDVSSHELLHLADASGSFDWLRAADEDIYSIEDGEEPEWPLAS